MRFLRWLCQRPELLVLTLIAALTRFWNIWQPNAIVFDEVYFKEFAGNYLSGTYYFDVHPPLGKLLLAVWGWVAHIPIQTLLGGDPATVLRLLPALAGVLIIPVFYILLRQLKASRKVATLGASLLLLDNALLVESRFILMDSMLLLFSLCAVVLYLAARKRSGPARFGLLAATGVLAGMSTGVKWTGLTAIALIGLAWIWEAATKHRRDWLSMLREVAVLTLVPLLVYASIFAIHFALLPRSGSGDGFMSDRFRSTLQDSGSHNPQANMSFVSKFVELNVAMAHAQTSLNSATHPYGSAWWSWPGMKRPVYYWQGPKTDESKQGNIYLLGNPVVWWGILLGLIAIVAVYARRPRVFKGWHLVLGFLAAGYLLNFLPFIGIHRVMFLYHYFLAFIFSLAFVVIGLGIAAGWMHENPNRPWSFNSRKSAAIYFGILVLAIAGFLYFLPLSYGIPLSPESLDQRQWLDSWR